MAESAGKKNKGTFMFLILFTVVFIVTLVYAFAPIRKSETAMDPVFSGWVYHREDQKTANAAMAKAGLTQYRWNDGELSVPHEEKGRYENVLADAKAFPRAPGDVKREALREMSQFEPMAKMKLRDLYSAGWQLEQTIEHFSTQISYATVGVRSRPEHKGMIQKNVVTASVGVWPKNDVPLTAELLSAITLATKHHLGITENNDISILDLRHGCSYLGTDAGVTAPVSKQVREDHLRQEYWNEKFLIAFRHIPGIKVSTSIARSVARTVPVLNTQGSDRKNEEPARPTAFAVLGNRLPTTLVSHPGTSPVPAICASGQGASNRNREPKPYTTASAVSSGEARELVTPSPGTALTHGEEETRIAVEIGIPEDYIRESIFASRKGSANQMVTAQEIAHKGDEIAASVKQEATGLLREVFAPTQNTLNDEAMVRVSILSTENLQTAITAGASSHSTVLEKPVRPADGTTQTGQHAINETQSRSTSPPPSSTSSSLEARLVELWSSNKHSPLFWILAIALTLVLTAMVLASVSFLLKRVAMGIRQCIGKRSDNRPPAGLDAIEDTLELRHDMPESKPVSRNAEEATAVINQWLRAG